MLKLKVFVLELGTVDALAAGAIALGEVTTLDHELLDDTVKAAALVVEGFPALANALLAGAEGAEVLSRLGDDIIVELEGDAAGSFLADGDVEKDAAALLGLFGHCV